MHTRQKRGTAADRRKQILAAAQKLFARQGFRGTTTRQIAELAGVNEAIVFRHFRRKDALYWTVLDEMTRRGKSREELRLMITDRQRAERLGRDDDEKFFTGVAEGILQRARREPALMRLLLFSALERHSLSHKFFRTYTSVYWDVLAKHIRSRMRAGEFRPINPLLAARSFTGMVAHYIWMQNLFALGKYQQFNDRFVARTLARIWLGGMQRAKLGARTQSLPDELK